MKLNPAFADSPPVFDLETGTFAVKAAAQSDLDTTRDIMRQIYEEDPSYWPHGLSTEHCDGGTYLVRKSASMEPIGFVGWQERNVDFKKVGFYAVGILPEYRGQQFAKRAVAKLIQEKAAGVDEVRAFIVPHNGASRALARSMNVPVMSKVAAFPLLSRILSTLGKVPGVTPAAKGLRWTVSNKGLSPGAASASNKVRAMAGGGAANAAFWDGWDRKDIPFTGEWDTNRTVTNAGNSVIGAGSAFFGAPAFITGLLGTPVKDMVVDARRKMNAGDFDTKGVSGLNIPAPNINVSTPPAAAPNVNVAAPNVNVAAPPTPNVTVNGGDGSKPNWGLIATMGLLGAGGLWAANKGVNALQEMSKQQDKGRMRITLATKKPGDEETQIEMPLNQINLSKTLDSRLRRDTLRRLREESSGRTRRINRQKAPGEIEPAVL